MRKYSVELSSPCFDYEGGDPVMEERPNGDYYEVYQVDAEIARLKAEADLLKAALRWCLENGAEYASEVVYCPRDYTIKVPPEFAAVIAQALGSKT